MVDLTRLLPPAIGMVAAVLLVTGAYYLLRFLGRRSGLARDLVQRAYRPSQAAVGTVAGWLGLELSGIDALWLPMLRHALLLGTIASVGWLGIALLQVVTDTALRKLRLNTWDPLVARRVVTRVRITHRVASAVVWVMALAFMLTTFDQVRTVGVSLLASAGLVGVIAAMAAQTMLSNFFAGLQIAFSDSLRLDDVVVVEGEWGWVEEITLRHVIVKIWDQRRLILPTSYFTTTPFENWTKYERELLGVVELDVDWTVPVADMRAELSRVLQENELWDGRADTLEVTEATGATVRVRALVSAADSSAQWALRCHVREQLVAWLQQHHPGALPRQRTELTGWEQAPSPPKQSPRPASSVAASDGAETDGHHTTSAAAPQ